MPLKALVSLSLGLLVVQIFAQKFSPENTQSALASLTEKEKIGYINKNFYSIYSADFKNSLELTRMAVALSQELKLPAQEALAQKNYGVILYLVGNYEEAQPAYLRSYDLYDSLGDKSGLARVSNEMGNYYQKQGQYEKALELWSNSAAMAEEADDFVALGTSYGMRATFYRIREQYEKSDPLYLKVHLIYSQQKDSVGLGYTFLDLADIERRKGNRKKALEHFRTSTDIRSKIGDYQGKLENYMALGDFHLSDGFLRNAIPWYQKAATESLPFGYPDLARKSLDSLSSIYKSLGEFETSLSYKVQAENLEDSLFNIERSKVISQLQTQYETERKEKQIVLQNAQISEQEAEIQRNRMLLFSSVFALVLLVIIALLWRSKVRKRQQMKLQEAELKAKEAEINVAISSQERERARYARDLHDGFGQMISILNMNLKTLEDGSKPNERQQVFEASEKVIEEMYGELKNICFDLMPQTLIKNGLQSALGEFSGRINQAGKIHVELNVFGLEKRLAELEEISLYRISQEWVNNILKYSDADKITLQITKDDEEITLLIEDNGMGFDKKLLTTGKGNGWKNLNTRANLIKGELELETTEGTRGCVLIVNAPLSSKTRKTLKAKLTALTNE